MKNRVVSTSFIGKKALKSTFFIIPNILNTVHSADKMSKRLCHNWELLKTLVKETPSAKKSLHNASNDLITAIGVITLDILKRYPPKECQKYTKDVA